LRVVLTGSADERDLANVVSRAMDEPSINAAGRTDMGMLAALLSRARLVVCNDTGISHLAAALRVPRVIAGLGSDLNRWAPGNQRRHRVVSFPVDCRPCEYRICPIGHPCSEKLDPDAVLSEARQLLQMAPAAAC